VIRIDGQKLRDTFQYFATSPETHSTMSTAKYKLPFSFSALDRLDDALRGLYPVMEQEDELLLDFIQPIDNVKTYMCYTLSPDRMIEIGKMLGNWEIAERDRLVYLTTYINDCILLGKPVPDTDIGQKNVYTCLFLDSFCPEYANYVCHVGLSCISRLMPVEKNLETFQHNLAIALYGVSGSDDRVEDLLTTTELVKIWHGRTIAHESTLNKMKEMVLEEVLRRIYDPSTSITALTSLVNALCPHLFYKTNDRTLPWKIVLEPDNPRVMGIMAHCRNKIPMKKGPAPLSTGFDPEIDN